MTGQEQISLTGIVLAGGQSRRMGRNKALMELEGQTLIARVLDKVSSLCDELIISANNADLYVHLPARVVPDVIPGRGALSGIHAGLCAMRNEMALVVACDMPFLNLRLLRYMVILAPGYDVIVPRVGEAYEPLHAIYGVNCIAPIEQLVARGPRRVIDFYEHVQVREIPQDKIALFEAELSFVNVNTPQEWANAQRLITQRD